MTKPCTDPTPSWFTGHWRDWHRGHGCDRDDGQSRSTAATAEITPPATNFLTDTELRMLRSSTSADDWGLASASLNALLMRALDELVARRAADKVREKLQAAPAFDHSARHVKHFDSRCGFCVCAHCAKLPEHDAHKEHTP